MIILSMIISPRPTWLMTGFRPVIVGGETIIL
jgi:hypothetical protein